LLPALALAAMALAGTGAALAQAAPGAGKVAVGCEVMGHDVIIYNRGETPVPAGTVVKWLVRFGNKTGEHKLDKGLEPSVGAYLVGALGGSYLWDRACVAEIVQAGAAAAAPAAARTQ
jgi:hypothetical protein